MLDGGSGIDRLSESGNVDFTLTGSQLTGLGTDLHSEFELAALLGGDGDNVLDARSFSGDTSLAGGSGNDTLRGSRQDDSLDGGDGDDKLFGALGNDTLTGGTGNDSLNGQSGDDMLVETSDVNFILTDSELTGLKTNKTNDA